MSTKYARLTIKKDYDWFSSQTINIIEMCFKIPNVVLYGGAGFAQLAAGTSDARWLFSFFDDPRDQERVKQGIKYYHEHPQLWLEKH